MQYATIPEDVENTASIVLNCAFKVHKALGPGLLESVYQTCLSHELKKININHEVEVSIPVNYDGIQIDAGFRLDILVNRHLIVELKAVEKVLPIHEAQLMTYLKLTNIRLGLLLNFNVPLLKEGIKRVVF